MAPSFSVGAIAVASRRANAVGAVRLTCAREGLEIDLLRAGAFAEGFAPGPTVERARFTVPYVGVRGLVRRGAVLELALDPAVARPFTRFALARFGDDPLETMATAWRWRARVRASAWLAPLPAGLLALAVARGGGGSLADAGATGALVALGVSLALFAVGRLLVWGGPLSDRYRDAFEVAMSERLGLVPARAVLDGPFDPVAAPAPDRRYAGLRATVAVAIAAASVVALVAAGRRFSAPSVVPPKVAPARLAVAAAAGQIETAGLIVRAPQLPRCTCARADSPLWSEGVPAVSVLLAPRDEEAPAAIALDPGGGVAVAPHADDHGRMRYDFEVAAVNNASRSERDVRVVATFARRDARGRRTGANDRGLFWEGGLGPGRAVKWSVGGPGTELRIDADRRGLLEGAPLPLPPGTRLVSPAPADAFHALLGARLGVVRLHGARMLAYLRDPRAAAAAQDAGAVSLAEEEIRARIARAARPVIACDLALGGATMDACVFNGSEHSVSVTALREVGPGARSFALAITVPVHDGVRVRVPLEGGERPREVTVESDR